MKRLIFSMHFEVPDNQFVDNKETNLNTKKQFLENHNQLLQCKQLYAGGIGCDFVFVNKYLSYYNEMKNKYPFLTTYNIINFYKIYLLYKFSAKYDEATLASVGSTNFKLKTLAYIAIPIPQKFCQLTWTHRFQLP